MKRPNILWLVGDHFAFKHYIDLYPQLQLKTYNHLAQDGIIFNQAYSVCPLCQPARTSMLTGTYPHRHGILINDEQAKQEFNDPNQKMVSHYLKEAGYRNVYFGKWHCGHDTTAQDYDFEGWSLPRYGKPYNSKEYSEYLMKKGLTCPEVTIEWDIKNPDNIGKSFKFGEPKAHPVGFGPWEAAGKVEAPLETHESLFVTDMACQWLENNATADQPFFMRVDVWGPHHPYHSCGEFLDSVDPESLNEYPGFNECFTGMPRNFETSRKKWDKGEANSSWKFWQPALARCFEQTMIVDYALGQVVSTLDNMGLADNTLVIYVADHGDLVASHGGLMNKDTLMVEETMRVPLVLRWPKLFRGGKSCNTLVSNMDLAATVLEAAQAPSFPVTLDSESLLPFCREPEAKGRDVLMCEDHGQARIEFFQRMIRWKNYKYIAHLDDSDELYDLHEDPYELKNVVSKPEYSSILKQMQNLTVEQMEKYNDCSMDAEKLKRQLKN